MTETRKATDRRELHFSSMAELLEDVEYLASGDPPRATGNWTSAQIVAHVNTVIECSIDGFPIPKASLPMRIFGRLMRTAALTKPMRPGFKIPKQFDAMVPRADTRWEEAVDALRASITRLESERMTKRSPILGKLTHEQWEQMHCRHAEMHFSFMHPS